MYIYTFFEGALSIALDVAVLVFDYIGVTIVLFTGLSGVVNFFRRDQQTKLKLAKGFAMGLEFKLGSEILRTVVVREVGEIVIVGSIILLRAALTFLIHWEIKHEESQQESEHMQEGGSTQVSEAKK